MKCLQDGICKNRANKLAFKVWIECALNQLRSLFFFVFPPNRNIIKMEQEVFRILRLILEEAVLHRWLLGTVTSSPSSQDSDSTGIIAFYKKLTFELSAFQIQMFFTGKSTYQYRPRCPNRNLGEKVSELPDSYLPAVRYSETRAFD